MQATDRRGGTMLRERAGELFLAALVVAAVLMTVGGAGAVLYVITCAAPGGCD